MAKNKPWFLYLIECRIPNVGNYFGITTRPLGREMEHKRRKNKGKLKAAMDLYGPENFIFQVISRFPDEWSARDAERDHIRKYNTGWPSGLNVLSTGEGVYSHPDYAASISARSGKQKSGWTEERKARHSRRMKRILGRKITRERMRESSKRRWEDQVEREKARIASTGVKRSEETKKKFGAAIKRKWADPEYKQKMKIAYSKKAPPSSETGAKISALSKARWAKPEGREKYVAAHKKAWTGEKGEARKQKLRERWADPEFKARDRAEKKSRIYTPESRARCSEARKRWWAQKKMLEHPQGEA